jgi:CubicO group peptidase (beta-lactamase class C family)
VNKALCYVAVVLNLAGAARGEEAKTPPAKTLEQLDRRLGELLSEAKVPGGSIAILEHGTLVFAKGYGTADVAAGTAVTPDTVFRAGSISKSVVGIAVMMLVEEGKLSLDAKLADLAPEIRFDNPWEATDPVRLVHLLEHTTGFDDIGFHHYFIEGTYEPLEKAIVQYGPYRSRWRPGTWVAYCNSAPMIAGYLVERASGMSWADFTRTHIFAPLGMSTAHWDRAPAIAGQLAKSYKRDGITEEPYVDIAGKPAGSLNITPSDLAKLVRLFIGRGTVDGVTLLTAASIDRIETPASSLAARSGLANGYGLGNMAMPREKAVFHGHDGGIDGFLSLYGYEPGHGAGFVAMVNAPQGSALEVADAIVEYLQRDWPAPELATILPDPVELQAIAGFYQPIAPRQQILAPLERLADWTRVKAIEGELAIGGTVRKATAAHQFRRADRTAATSIFLASEAGPLMLTATGARQRVPLIELLGKATWGVLFALTLVLTLFYLPVWVIAALRGRLQARGGIPVHLLPALTMLTMTAVAATLFYYFAGGGDTLQGLGKPTLAARAIYVLSWGIPVGGVLSLLAAWRAKPETTRLARALAVASGLLAISAAIFLWPYGWIGLRTWM